jgi:hypothetical protein
MPFPALLIWGAAIFATGVGVKKGFDAKSDFDRAKRIGEYAEEKMDKEKKSLEDARVNTQKALEKLGKVKVQCFANQIKYLIEMIEKRNKKGYSKISGFEEDISIENLDNVKEFVLQSLEIEKGIGTGAVTGALAALGAYGSVGMLATASTGTAIGTLSGAAATNATLAWLGGGALAAGGFGMAGGMVALGGIVLGPALAVGGFLMASKAEEAVTKAREYEAQVDVAIEEIKTIKTEMKAIRAAAAEQENALIQLANRFDQVKITDVDDTAGFKQMALIGKNLKALLDIPVLKEDGTANKNIKSQCAGLLEIGENA